jgi:CubicO group peptidase (beta-lactamase class C family)
LVRLSAIARRTAHKIPSPQKKCIVAFLVALMVSTGASCRAVQTPQTDQRYVQQLQPLLERFVQWQEIPGLAIGIIENNRLVYAHAFGVKQLGRSAEPVTTRSLFHMASITKPFVATAIMQLVERGMLDLDAPVVKYLPYFRLADDRYNQITVRQMATHTSGMPDVEDYEWDKPQYDDGALERYVRSLTNQKLLFPPGERVRYSNMAFEVLGDVVAKASGESFDDYVQRHILTPLQMTDSTLLLKQASPALLTWGHELDEQGVPFPSRVFPYNRMHSPSSNLHSNVLDMARWAIANMNRGELEGHRILQSTTHDIMWTPAHQLGGRGEDGQVAAVGVSWFLGVYRGTRMITHEGGDTGYRTDLVLLPDKRIAVVWMENADWAANDNSLTRAALDVALGVTPAPILTRRTIESTLPTYQRGGIEAALNQYRMLRKGPRAELYNFDEGGLNAFGQYLIRQGHLQDAIRALETNVEFYPTSGRAADALATAYEMDHNLPLAIRTYQTAVTLDPTLSHARDRLKQLKQLKQ